MLAPEDIERDLCEAEDAVNDRSDIEAPVRLVLQILIRLLRDFYERMGVLR